MPADRATCEADIPGSKDAATSCSFSDRDHRRRRSTGRTSDRAIVITKLLELLLGLSRSDLPNKAVPGVCVHRICLVVPQSISDGRAPMARIFSKSDETAAQALSLRSAGY